MDNTRESGKVEAQIQDFIDEYSGSFNFDVSIKGKKFLVRRMETEQLMELYMWNGHGDVDSWVGICIDRWDGIRDKGFSGVFLTGL